MASTRRTARKKRAPGGRHTTRPGAPSRWRAGGLRFGAAVCSGTVLRALLPPRLLRRLRRSPRLGPSPVPGDSGCVQRPCNRRGSRRNRDAALAVEPNRLRLATRRPASPALPASERLAVQGRSSLAGLPSPCARSLPGFRHFPRLPTGPLRAAPGASLSIRTSPSRTKQVKQSICNWQIGGRRERLAAEAKNANSRCWTSVFASFARLPVRRRWPPFGRLAAPEGPPTSDKRSPRPEARDLAGNPVSRAKDAGRRRRWPHNPDGPCGLLATYAR